MKRRQFLSTSAFAGTATLLAPHARAQGANSELRVAVVGFNSRGSGHIQQVINHPKARLVALCDVDKNVLEKKKAELEKKNIKVDTYTDYRKLCENKDIDAITIATCNHTHTLITLIAAEHGKHVYVEKPVCHNIWEGQKLVEGQEKYGTIISHGFQRRSEGGWMEALEWIKEGHIGNIKIARGFCYKPRKSIGKVSGPKKPPAHVDYDLWIGPREMTPVMRERFHYDWHWQSLYGNGDLGNQGPHQLDVCRWALDDPMHLPEKALSFGGRYGYDDDGDTPNTQILFLDYEKCPIMFEVRGLPSKGLNWKNGMDTYKGVTIGNVIEYEGGKLIGGHTTRCKIEDASGKTIKEFTGGGDHIHSWVDACLSGKQNPMHNAENGHLSSSLAHMGNLSLKIGYTDTQERIASANAEQPVISESFGRLCEHLSANGMKDIDVSAGRIVEFDKWKKDFKGTNEKKVRELDREFYRPGFTLPNA